MSLPALAHVMYEVRGIDPTAKLVLLAIADHVHSETGWAWPSTTRLADLAGVSKRSVIRHIDTLETAGLLEVDRRTGRASGYRIAVLNPKTTGDTSVTTPARTGDTDVTTAVTPTTPLTGDTHDTSTDVPVTPVTQTGDTGVTQTVKNQEEEDEEDDTADTADTDAARLADRVDTVTAITPATWAGQPIHCDNRQLTDALDTLTAAGWTNAQLRAACANLPKPRTNPTGLLTRHLHRLTTTSPDAIASNTNTTPTPGAPAPECHHGVPSFAWCSDCAQETRPAC